MQFSAQIFDHKVLGQHPLPRVIIRDKPLGNRRRSETQPRSPQTQYIFALGLTVWRILISEEFGLHVWLSDDSFSLCELLLHDSVAFARDTFQLIPVGNANSPTADLQDALRRKALDQAAHTAALHAEQASQKLMCDCKTFNAGSVQSSQHPTGTPLLHRM